MSQPRGCLRKSKKDVKQRILPSWPGFPVPPSRALALCQDPTPQSCVSCSLISLSCPAVVTKYVFWDIPRSWGYKESSVLPDGQFSKEFRGSGSHSLQPRLSAQTQCRRQAESSLGSKNFLYYDWLWTWLQFSRLAICPGHLPFYS